MLGIGIWLGALKICIQREEVAQPKFDFIINLLSPKVNSRQTALQFGIFVSSLHYICKKGATCEWNFVRDKLKIVVVCWSCYICNQVLYSGAPKSNVGLHLFSGLEKQFTVCLQVWTTRVDLICFRCYLLQALPVWHCIWLTN